MCVRVVVAREGVLGWLRKADGVGVGVGVRCFGWREYEVEGMERV